MVKCLVPNCDSPAQIKDLCKRHYRRQWCRRKKGYLTEPKALEVTLYDLTHPEYKNHHLMKKNRLIKLAQINYICEECHIKPAIEIHHQDFDKTNHQLNNLMGLCHRCHLSIYHKGHKAKPKLFEPYTLAQLREKTGISISLFMKYAHNQTDLRISEFNRIQSALITLGIKP